MVRKLHLKADTELARIEQEIPFTAVNPENADEIKKKFLRKPFEPEFVYADPPDLVALKERLDDVKCGRTKPGRLLKKEKEQLQKKIAFFDALGTERFTEASSALYGLPSEENLERAYQLLELSPAPKAEKITTKEVSDIMHKAFELLGFTYTVKRTKMVTSAYLSPSSRTVQLRSKERFSRLYAYRLVVHELGTHALRAENGRKQGLGIFSRGTAGYLATEEGFAAYNEERANVMTTDILRNYAGRLVAVAYALEHTFVETYKHLREWFTKEDAFKLTLRAKRGLPHGGIGGACTKDHVYLDGYFAVKKYAAEGGDLEPLMAAKIGLDDLKEWGGKLEKPTYTQHAVIEWVRHQVLTVK